MEFRADVCDQEIDRIKINMDKFAVEIKGMESLTKMRDLETQRANANQEEMKMSFAREIAALSKTINNIEFKINNTLAAYDQRITLG